MPVVVVVVAESSRCANGGPPSLDLPGPFLRTRQQESRSPCQKYNQREPLAVSPLQRVCFVFKDGSEGSN